MSRPQLPDSEQAGRQIIELLASNKTAFTRLVEYGEYMLSQEQEALQKAAISALLHPADRDGAVLQCGRVEMLRDLCVLARRHLNK